MHHANFEEGDFATGSSQNLQEAKFEKLLEFKNLDSKTFGFRLRPACYFNKLLFFLPSSDFVNDEFLYCRSWNLKKVGKRYTK